MSSENFSGPDSGGPNNPIAIIIVIVTGIFSIVYHFYRLSKITSEVEFKPPIKLEPVIESIQLIPASDESKFLFPKILEILQRNRVFNEINRQTALSNIYWKSLESFFSSLALLGGISLAFYMFYKTDLLGFKGYIDKIVLKISKYIQFNTSSKFYKYRYLIIIVIQCIIAFAILYI